MPEAGSVRSRGVSLNLFLFLSFFPSNLPNIMEIYSCEALFVAVMDSSVREMRAYSKFAACTSSKSERVILTFILVSNSLVSKTHLLCAVTYIKLKFIKYVFLQFIFLSVCFSLSLSLYLFLYHKPYFCRL